MDLPPTPKHQVLLAKIKRRYEELANEKVKELLEQKHLYQSLLIEFQVDQAELVGLGEPQARFVAAGAESFTETWWEIEPAILPGGPPTRRITDRPDKAHLHVDSVKLFCPRCERVEAYNLVYAFDLYEAMKGPGIKLSSGRPEQLIVLAYLCQSCKARPETRPETFFIARHARKITLVGRQPIEHVDVPNILPKRQRRNYSDSVVAYQSGQILPALFMLRTIIEQHAAETVGRKEGERADQLVERYMQAIPEPVRAHFPSPREIYSRLSAAIHVANADALLFERSTAELLRHFDALRLYGQQQE